MAIRSTSHLGRSRIRLMDANPELTAHVSAEGRQWLQPVRLPVFDVSRGTLSLDATGSPAFGVMVLEGLVLHYVQLGDQRTMRILGPGALLTAEQLGHSAPGYTYRGGADTRVVQLGDEFLLAARQVPALLIGLQRLIGVQQERMAAHLAICQLSRVGDRLMAMFWQLAEMWGRVTSTGTILPLVITHEVLGNLVGARRPTVTLALGELIAQGAILPLDRGWLLLRAAVDGEAPLTVFAEPPRLVLDRLSDWREGPANLVG